MSGITNESETALPPMGVRQAAIALLAAMDREGEAMIEGADAYATALSAQNEAERALRQALAVERSNMPAISGAEVAREGVELIKAGGQISTDHIRAIVQATEWAFEAADANALRWDADMRAIKHWQAAGEGRDLICPDHVDLVLWLLELIELRPPCPSIHDVADKIATLRTAYPLSPTVLDGAKMLEEMANALVASSRRVVQAESDRRVIPGLIAVWVRVEGMGAGARLADGIIAGAWHPLLNSPAAKAERAARPPLQLVSGCEEAIASEEPDDPLRDDLVLELPVHDSLHAVLRRPDVQEAIAKALAAERGADWQEATEGGRNAFREEAAGLLRVALDQPK